MIENLQKQVDLAQSYISGGGSIWEGERMLTSSLLEFRKCSFFERRRLFSKILQFIHF